MPLRPRRYLQGLAVLLSAALMLGACSRFGLVYGNLEWLLPWRLNHYLDLDREQRAWLRPRLQAHLSWHCSAELPRYLHWLARGRQLLEAQRPDAKLLEAHLAEFESAVQRIAVQVTPTAIDLLRDLDAQQVARLQTALAADNRDDWEEYLEPPLARQITERAERMEDRLRPWLGALNPDQRRRIGQWSAQLGEQNRVWLNSRAHWQTQLQAVLLARRAPEFGPRLTHLLQRRHQVFGAAYERAHGDARRALAELFADLISSADHKQRQRLDRRLRELGRDIAEQLCEAPVTASLDLNKP